MTCNIMMNDAGTLHEDIYYTHQHNVQMPGVVSSCADGATCCKSCLQNIACGRAARYVTWLFIKSTKGVVFSF